MKRGLDRPALGLAAAALLAIGCGADREPLRDAWALWLEHRPFCVEAVEGEAAPPPEPVPPARAVLAAEVLAVMEGLLADGGARGEEARLLARLVADSHRLCELSRGEPVASLASTVAAARADLAATRSRLRVALPLGDGEVRRRSAPWDHELAEAVSRALEAAAGPSPPVLAEAGDPALPEASSPAAPRAPAAAGDAGDAAAGPPGSEEPEASISIRTVSGESFTAMRQRRRREAAERFARWLPLYTAGLERLTALRRELAIAVERESLEGSREVCARFGQAAEETPREVVRAAPSPSLAADLEAMLEAYAAAGRSCSAGRLVGAWSELASGDEHRAAAARAVAELASGPPIPDSVRRKTWRGNAPGGAGVR